MPAVPTTVLLRAITNLGFALLLFGSQTAWSADPATILPINLRIPQGCIQPFPYALNNGSLPDDLVIVGAAPCENSSYLPHTWRAGVWTRTTLPEGTVGGYAKSVSDLPSSEPTVTFVLGVGSNSRAWVKSAGQPIVSLPLSAGMTFADNAVINPGGTHIAGRLYSVGKSAVVRWVRSGDAWLVPEVVKESAFVAAITADGNVIVGNSPRGPWLWTASPGGGGQEVALGTDAKSTVTDITHTGSMAVGYTERICPNQGPPCDYEVPVYWVPEGGQWAMHELQALDDVDSEAKAVAEVAGKLIIAGSGFTNQDGGILRPVVWIPEADGSYGEPVRLLAVGGFFESWAEASDINRNGVVAGWSDLYPWDGGDEFPPGPTVLWNLSGETWFQINSGLNDAWYDPATNGQGFFISVFPDSGKVFLAWFTYDTERPPSSVDANLGDSGHRWLTAFGAYDGSQAVLEVERTFGGTFNSASPQPAQELDGTITMQFTGCNAGTISFDIPSIDQQGTIPIQRIAEDNIAACEQKAAALAGGEPTAMPEQLPVSAPAAGGNFTVNAGLNDAWYNPATNGQGFFLDVFPEVDKVFLAWFTYDTERPADGTWYDLGEPGHRWLTAFGDYSGNEATLDIEVTEGGVFNAAEPAPLQRLDGSITLEFAGCNEGTVSYAIPSINRQGVIPIERIADDNVAACEALAAQAQQGNAGTK